MDPRLCSTKGIKATSALPRLWAKAEMKEMNVSASTSILCKGRGSHWGYATSLWEVTLIDKNYAKGSLVPRRAQGRLMSCSSASCVWFGGRNSAFKAQFLHQAPFPNVPSLSEDPVVKPPAQDRFSVVLHQRQSGFGTRLRGGMVRERTTSPRQEAAAHLALQKIPKGLVGDYVQPQGGGLALQPPSCHPPAPQHCQGHRDTELVALSPSLGNLVMP